MQQLIRGRRIQQRSSSSSSSRSSSSSCHSSRGILTPTDAGSSTRSRSRSRSRRSGSVRRHMASNSDAAQVAKPARAKRSRSRSRSRSRRSAGTQAGRASGTACAAPSKEEAHEATSKGGRVGGAPATEQAPEKVADVDWQLTGMSEGQQIKQCAAFRVKYRLKDAAGQDLPLINIAPHLVAWHRKNRRGMYPNADRCQQLLHS